MFYSLNIILIIQMLIWIGVVLFYEALLISHLAHLIISLIQYDKSKLNSFSIKFIKINLSNLIVTVENLKKNRWRIYLNFNFINGLLCLKKVIIT